MVRGGAGVVVRGRSGLMVAIRSRSWSMVSISRSDSGMTVTMSGKGICKV